MAAPNPTRQLNWKTDTAELESLTFINWETLEQYASKARRALEGADFACRLSFDYNMGGLHVVRRLIFDDGYEWLARLQLEPPTPESCQRLQNEVDAMAAVRYQSKISVPRVFAYDISDASGVGAAFMLMEFIPGDTAMDSFGGWDVHKGETPTQFKDKFYAALAHIQVEMAAVRFPKIGSIVGSGGQFEVGPIPGIGGPFDTAAQYFEAWAKVAKFPYKEETIRPRTPADLVDEVLAAIRSFPSGIRDLARWFPFQDGPFPLIHTDLYSSNIIIDENYNVLSVIDWENAFVGPWELVEFNKELSIVPPVMDGPLYRDTESDIAMRLARAEFVKTVREAEERRRSDKKLSDVLADEEVQALSHAFWLYGDGRIGFYDRVLRLLDYRRVPEAQPE
ncbi:hypothetical protein KVR01_013391 [Diaporthe batatas]|uniref:uncharacterized protein n=1 Tax=Diaporthe batatas TaxID=748121 RepID=UPI001D05025B|nr:uncharacterized protein KVR01_013391 [Diaporthe batatas]KAG8156786.1 hypothetical protein KVR01_013391 [Diaporthe batatas]